MGDVSPVMISPEGTNRRGGAIRTHEVKFAYDSEALYVGFRLWSRDGSAIQAPLGRRDVCGQAEHVIVSLDTYHERAPYAYNFGGRLRECVSIGSIPEDSADGADAGFDPVWNRDRDECSGGDRGIWIPFSQLRFHDGPRQIWGLNVARFTPLDERGRLLGRVLFVRDGLGLDVRRNWHVSMVSHPAGALELLHTLPAREAWAAVDTSGKTHSGWARPRSRAGST